MRTHLVIGASLFALMAHPGHARGNPPNLAAQARLDVNASPEVGSLRQGSAVFGGGQALRMNWLGEAEQRRTYVAHWPIAHIRWSEVGFRFVPASNGVIALDLLGPWEKSPGGALYLQEVLWDALTVSGAVLTNGGFEQPDGWANPWGGPVLFEQDQPAREGARSARVWHDRRLRTSLRVTGGQEVTVRAWVRARVPDGYVDQPRLADTNSAAHRTARKFMRGVNFSNFFEAPAGEDWGGGPLGTSDFAAVRAQGFDHVRLPVSWNYHTGPGPTYTISNAFFTQVDAVVTGLLARGVNVLLNLHHFNEFYADPAGWTNKLYALWDQLAVHYDGYPDGLAFEILNEPHDNATTEVMNGIYAHLLPRLRLTHPQRTLFVGPGQWSSIEQLPALRLPADDRNLVVTVHNYQPFYFTHQGASWTGPSTATTNLVYPGPPPRPVVPHPDAAGDRGVVAWLERYNTLPRADNPCSSNAFEQSFCYARDWSDYYGRPIYVGEFGAFHVADQASRARFYREMRESLDRHGLGWAIWDWKSGFFFWDRKTGAPAPGLREALFPGLSTRAR